MLATRFRSAFPKSLSALMIVRMNSTPNLIRREIVRNGPYPGRQKSDETFSRRTTTTLDDSRFDALAAEVHVVRQSGRRVCSYERAIGAGIGLLGLDKRPDDLRTCRPRRLWDRRISSQIRPRAAPVRLYRAAQLCCSQRLPPRARILNVRILCERLFEYNAIPTSTRTTR